MNRYSLQFKTSEAEYRATVRAFVRCIPMAIQLGKITPALRHNLQRFAGTFDDAEFAATLYSAMQPSEIDPNAPRLIRSAPAAALPGAEAGTPLLAETDVTMFALLDLGSALAVCDCADRKCVLNAANKLTNAGILAVIAERRALTSEVARLQANWDEAFEVHESDKVTIIDLRAENARLTSEVRALREDAERYRFLRDNGLAKALRSRHPGLMELAFGYEGDETVFKTGLSGGYTSELIDTALDAARLASPSPTGAE